MIITEPLLAAKKPVFEKIKFPVIATPKIDGIRCVREDDKALSRSFKPIPNKFVRNVLENILPRGFDGELVAGDTFCEVSSAIMSHEGEPDFRYKIFDYVRDSLDKPYVERLKDMKEFFDANPELLTVCIPMYGEVVNSLEELQEVIDRHLSEGHEGTMIRMPNSPYKCGRSSLKEGYLVAIKHFEDAEATVIGFKEAMHNANEAEEDAFGRTERSSKKENMVAKGTLGALLCKTPEGIEFKIGTGKGLTQELRQEIWDNQDKYLGQLVKYRFQPHGVKDKPRVGSWLGFRHPDDVS